MFQCPLLADYCEMDGIPSARSLGAAVVPILMRR